MCAGAEGEADTGKAERFIVNSKVLSVTVAAACFVLLLLVPWASAQEAHEEAMPATEGQHAEQQNQQNQNQPEQHEEPPVEQPQPEMAPTPPPAPSPMRPIPVRPRAVRPPARPEQRRPAAPVPGQGATPQEQGQQRMSENAPKTGGTPEEPVSFDFVDTPLTQVVESIARMTGKNFDVDPAIAQQRVTIITHEPIPPELAYKVLESIVSVRGYTLVPTLDGKLIRVVPYGDSMDKVGLEIGRQVSQTFDTIVTNVVEVRYADAAELTSILKSLGSKNAIVDAYARTNTLIVTDTADGMERMMRFLEVVDVPGFDTEVEMFTLEYARAEELAAQIQEVLMGTGAAPRAPGQPQAPTRPSTPVRIPPRPNVPGQSAPVVAGNREETLRIVPDERLNTLIVIATPALMTRVRELVQKLDTPTPYEANNMNVYKLLNAPADKVEEALNGILGAAPRQGPGGGERGLAQSGEVQPFEKKVIVTAYEQINALLILASPQDYKLIREIIAQLDVPQRQVLVEAVIMDVSIQDTFGLAVDFASITGEDAFALGSTSNISSIFNVEALTGVTELAEGLAGNGSLAIASNLLNLGASGGLTFGIYDTIDATINGQKVQIPFVPFLVKALETLTDVDILSQPSLTTQDNEEASIIVGQELPVPTVRSGYTYDPRVPSQQQQYPTYGLTSYGRGISREDVGVKMTVTPHINEGDYVSLETTIEVSEATPSDIGVNVNELGPTFNKSQVENNVVVKDGSTGVIGGLIKETASHNRTQTPILGDLPLLGWLFRNTSDVRKKQNVVVLVTPYIVKEGVDLDRVSEYKMNQWRASNVDVLFEKGFIKRIKKGQYMRKNYRPSINRGEKMKEEGVFGRGKIER